MTEEQIKKIAEEYADMYMERNIPLVSKKDNIRNTLIREAKTVLNILAERFYLVEKGEAKKLCELAVNESSSIDYALIDGLTDWVESEFNEEYHNTIDGKGPDIRKEEDI